MDGKRFRQGAEAVVRHKKKATPVGVFFFSSCLFVCLEVRRGHRNNI